MNAITKTENNALALSEAELCGVLQTSLYPGAEMASIKMVIAYCKAAKLDPMQKPVHIVPMWNSKLGKMVDVIMPGVNLYRTQAMRSGECAGVTEPEYGPDITENIGGQTITFPHWCRVTTKRLMANGQIAEFTAREFWKENYAVRGGKEKSIAPNGMWAKRIYGQIAKCAQAQSLRMAFPELAAAPTAEEMEGKSMHFDESPAPEIDYVDPALFMRTVADLHTDQEAADYWKLHNGKLAKQPADHAAFKAAIIARRTALKNAQATDVPDKNAKPAAATVKTFEQVMKMLIDAGNQEARDVAHDWIGAINDEDEQNILFAKYEELSGVTS